MLQIFEEAQKNKYAVGQFNVSNADQLKAVMQAAKNLKSPTIIATSEGESKFFGKRQIRSLIDAWKNEINLSVLLHMDHGKNFDIVKGAIEAGYDSVHFDGSGLDFQENIRQTKEVVDFAKKHNIGNIEGELGYLKGGSAIHEAVEIKKEDLTKAEEVLEFVEKTGVDSLAVVIGNVHGIFKGGKNPRLFLDRLKEISDKLGGRVALVLHGGSGISEEDIKEAINLGIVKINVNTELRIAFTESLKKSLVDNPEQTTPYKILPLVVEGVQKVVEEKIKLFGSDNK
ncbi:MAG: class II fructose-bisphosphate aldolase [bacterium]